MYYPYSFLLIGFAFLFFPLCIHNVGAKDNTIADFITKGINDGKKANALLDEKSPYLLQHAFNPVHWFPWGEKAFEKARTENKPIFLSIGYSTCHWCHVMAHESFENERIAEILNKYFICIKVDREERPDLDHIYMAATQALTGGGGWPMSVFLTPALKPFYAGTYFPPESKHGLPGFADLLQSIQQAWENDRENILDSAEKITAHLRNTNAQETSKIAEGILDKGYNLTVSQYDSKFGGFGSAPKFPRPVIFNFLLRYYHKNKKQTALEITTHTLHEMAEGGMYDQIGGGFHRYSVDEQWRVPHFEKMLYDQSQLTISYLEAYQLTQDSFFAAIARDTLDYVLRDMTSAEGGFYSAEDADSPLPENPSEKAEGAFYVWSEKEIEKLLGKDGAALVNYHYGIKPEGNALTDPHNEFTGKNILYAAHSLENTAQHFKKTADAVENILKKSREKLLSARNQRPRPHLDDKVITSWNGLMISALAKGYQVLDEKNHLMAAEKAAGFILDTLYDKAGKILYRRYRKGEAGLSAVLEDYAFLVQGLLDLYEASFDTRWLEAAVNLNEIQITLFEDKKDGGFYNTSGKDASVLLRMKTDYDGAEPTGNSVAALNLFRLSQITNDNALHKMAVKTMETFAAKLQKYPPIMPQMLVAYDFQMDKPKQIIIAGERQASDTKEMIREVNKRFLPSKTFILADSGTGQEYLAQKLPFLNDMKAIDGKATAFICENYTCKLPTTDIKKMAAMLAN
jgi:hypothetical protein